MEHSKNDSRGIQSMINLYKGSSKKMTYRDRYLQGITYLEL